MLYKSNVEKQKCGKRQEEAEKDKAIEEFSDCQDLQQYKTDKRDMDTRHKT